MPVERRCFHRRTPHRRAHARRRHPRAVIATSSAEGAPALARGRASMRSRPMTLLVAACALAAPLAVAPWPGSSSFDPQLPSPATWRASYRPQP
eukprot:scaffold5382_cov114-Isochrysis_galbana.AAC.7